MTKMVPNPPPPYFICLILITDNKVDTETFETFCDCYQENLENCLMIDHSALNPEEYVLKLSSLCKTDVGSGRIVLTNKR